MDSSPETGLRLEQLLPMIREQLERGQSVRFGPQGCSMLPLLRQGKDRVVLSPVKGRLKKYDIALYRRENGQFVLHRIIAVSQEYTCMGDHQVVAETGIRQQQLIGVVSAVIRDGREVSVSSLPYRIYCHIWCALMPLRKVWAKRNRLFIHNV